MKSAWQLQEAKNRLSELVDRAVQSGPQEITRRGRRTAVVLSVKDYAKLRRKKGSLVEFFRKAPLRGIALERTKDFPREVDL